MEYIVSDKEPGCPFCRALDAGDDKAGHILHRGTRCFIILNKYPYNNGHLMVLPYRHVAELHELTPEERLELIELVELSVRVLRESSRPDGFNVGMNLGTAAGAGVLGHLHMHVVPRWNGDTNYMTVINQVRTIPELLEETWGRLKPVLDVLITSPEDGTSPGANQ
ncbi:MAG: HIT domain-containing protein [Ardenticatenia bacterium]|nr:HIT domain-containing protein [Ardenticatenia bacterium]